MVENTREANNMEKALSDVHFSKYILVKENWPKQDYYLMFSTITRSVVVVEKPIFENLMSNNFDKIPNEYIEKLFEEGFLTKLNDETTAVKYIFQKSKFGTSSLGAMVLTTYDCNLSCEYCIENEVQGYREEYMMEDTSNEVVEWLESKIAERHPTILELVFYGGEPLLNKKPIFDISRHFHEDVLKGTLDFSFGIITNGSIEIPVEELKELTEYGLKYVQITLDGTAHTHDLRRPNKDGSGTFSKIVENLQVLIEYVPVIVRINIDKSNAGDIENLIDYLYTKKLNTKITLDLAPRMKSGYKPMLCDANVMLDKEFSDFFSRLLVTVREKGFSISRRFVDAGPCLLSSESQFVIDPVGDIYKCSGFVGRKEFAVGNVNEQKLDSNYIEFIMMDRWEDCINCPYVPLCGGGCAFESFVKLGDYKKRVCKKSLFSSLTMGVLSTVDYNNAKVKALLEGDNG
jgi:uncharacterized protein